MTIQIDTESVPAAERFEFWCLAAYSSDNSIEVFTHQQERFHGKLHSRSLGAVRIGLITSTPYGVRRSGRLLNSSDPELLRLLMPLPGNGRCQPVVSQDGRDAPLAPGQFAIYDTSRPYEVHPMHTTDGPIKALTMAFAGSLLPLHLDRIRRVTAMPMATVDGVGRLTARFLMQLAEDLDEYRPPEAARLATMALDIVATRLLHESDFAPKGEAKRGRRALLMRVRNFIQQNLPDPQLSAATVAAAHHISVRYLYKLFEDEGITVGSWIREQRLERCRNDLLNPALAARSVSRIAANWGFSNAAHFNRVFRTRYGVPPGAYRQMFL